MTYRGRVHNGVVVVEDGPSLAEGTQVRIEVDRPIGSPPRGSAEALLAADKRWEGPPGELDTLLTEASQMRDEDLRLESQRQRPRGPEL